MPGSECQQALQYIMFNDIRAIQFKPRKHSIKKTMSERLDALDSGSETGL